MLTQLYGAILISLLHGLIPSHWLPVVAIGKKMKWTEGHVLRVALYAGIAHALSTVVIGVLVALFGNYVGHEIEWFSKYAPAVVLTALGIWFIYRHYTHHHFHLTTDRAPHKSIVWPILLAMFLSPCMEIEGYYFVLGLNGWKWITILSIIYFSISVLSIFTWVFIAWKGAQKINAHRWEHSSGIITGVVLIASGVLFFF